MDYFDDYDETPPANIEKSSENPENFVNNFPKPDDENNEDGLADVATAKPVKQRKLGSRQSVLTVDKLLSDNGIVELRNTLSHTKFRGKGHEIEDLNTMMSTMQYWAHRLCPRMTFDEVLAKIEELGTKRPVQTALTKLRQGESIKDEGDVNASIAAVEDDNQYNEFSLSHGATRTIEIEQPKTELTDEQRRKIEENKRRAQELRATRNITVSQEPQFIEDNDDFDDFLASWDTGAHAEANSGGHQRHTPPRNFEKGNCGCNDDSIDWMNE